MKTLKPVIMAGVVVIVFSLPGCGLIPEWVPEKWATFDEAFPENEVLDLSKIPGYAYQKRVFKVPYADAFDIASKSATQAGFDVVAEDQRRGEIHAMHAWSRYTTLRLDYRNFIKIKLKELGANKTEVLLLIKEQGKCDKNNLFWKECGEYISKPTYKVREIDSDQGAILSRFITVFRNNLISSGLI